MKLKELSAKPEYLYHVTFTKNVPNIKKKGLVQFQPSNWVKGPGGDRYNNDIAGIFAFDHPEDALNWAGKMEWEFRDTDKDMSIVRIDMEDFWEDDPAEDPFVSNKGKARYSNRNISADKIIDVLDMSGIKRPGDLGISRDEWLAQVSKKLTEMHGGGGIPDYTTMPAYGLKRAKKGKHKFFVPKGEKLPAGVGAIKEFGDTDILSKKDVEMYGRRNLKAKPIVYVDMDGVLVDFFGEWANMHGVESWRDILPLMKSQGKTIDDALDAIRARDDFWINLKPHTGAKALLAAIKKHAGEYIILSSPLSNDPNSEPQKRAWVKNNLSAFLPKEVIIHKRKQDYATQADGTPNILIDDFSNQIKPWKAAGGIALKHSNTNTATTVTALKQQFESAVTEATQKYYHGSHDKFEVGEILTPGEDDYEEGMENVEWYHILHQHRPMESRQHSWSVFMTGNEDDIDVAGGSTDYVYEVEPIGDVERHDINWASEISYLLDAGHKPDSNEIKEAAANYWAGKPHHNEQVWEYLAPKAKIVGMLDEGEVIHHDFRPIDPKVLQHFRQGLEDPGSIPKPEETHAVINVETGEYAFTNRPRDGNWTHMIPIEDFTYFDVADDPNFFKDFPEEELVNWEPINVKAAKEAWKVTLPKKSKRKEKSKQDKNWSMLKTALESDLFEEGAGDCFHVAGRTMIDMTEEQEVYGMKMIHAYVYGQGELKGRRFPHAWIEQGDVVLDNSNGNNIVMRKEQYYPLGGIVEESGAYATYVKEDCLVKMLKHSHWGPWDLNDSLDEGIPDEVKEIGKKKSRIPSKTLNTIKDELGLDTQVETAWERFKSDVA